MTKIVDAFHYNFFYLIYPGTEAHFIDESDFYIAADEWVIRNPDKIKNEKVSLFVTSGNLNRHH